MSDSDLDSGSDDFSDAARISYIIFMRNLKICHYMTVAGFALWLWDVLITFGDEVTYVWRRKGSLIKTLYFLNRYLPLITLGLNMHTVSPHAPLSTKACQALIICTTGSYALGMIVTPTIFVMRVYSISESCLNARRILVLVAAVSHLLVVVFTIIGFVHLTPTILYVNQVGACAASINWTSGALYASPILVETVVFLTTIYHAISYDAKGTLLSRSPAAFILRTLYFDGTIYYLIILTVRVAVVILIYGPILDFFMVLSFLDCSLTSVITSRWFLSFRKAVADSHQKQLKDGSEWTGDCLSLDTVFWKTRTTDTGPGITFYGTKGSAEDSGVYSEFAGAVRSMNVTTTATVSNKRDIGLELSTGSPLFRLSFDQDRDGFGNTGGPTNPKSRTRRQSQVTFAPTKSPLPEEQSTVDHSNGAQNRLTTFPARSPTSIGSMYTTQNSNHDSDS